MAYVIRNGTPVALTENSRKHHPRCWMGADRVWACTGECVVAAEQAELAAKKRQNGHANGHNGSIDAGATF
jgi:hypothetical protein